MASVFVFTHMGLVWHLYSWAGPCLSSLKIGHSHVCCRSQDLVASPESTMREVNAYLDLPSPPSTLVPPSWPRTSTEDSLRVHGHEWEIYKDQLQVLCYRLKIYSCGLTRMHTFLR